MITPVEGKVSAWVGARLWAWAKDYAKRYAHLEQRVTALEAALEKQPGNACPFCGERAMRLDRTSTLFGSAGKQFREETWKCQKCDKSLMHAVNY